MWHGVIEKCVTVFWLKQFRVAHCVACCYWKGCIPGVYTTACHARVQGSLAAVFTEQTRISEPMLGWCWADVVERELILGQRIVFAGQISKKKVACLTSGGPGLEFGIMYLKGYVIRFIWSCPSFKYTSHVHLHKNGLNLYSFNNSFVCSMLSFNSFIHWVTDILFILHGNSNLVSTDYVVEIYCFTAVYCCFSYYFYCCCCCCCCWLLLLKYYSSTIRRRNIFAAPIFIRFSRFLSQFTLWWITLANLHYIQDTIAAVEGGYFFIFYAYITSSLFFIRQDFAIGSMTARFRWTCYSIQTDGVACI